jgi:hypothetical protein
MRCISSDVLPGWAHRLWPVRPGLAPARFHSSPFVRPCERGGSGGGRADCAVHRVVTVGPGDRSAPAASRPTAASETRASAAMRAPIAEATGAVARSTSGKRGASLATISAGAITWQRALAAPCGRLVKGTASATACGQLLTGGIWLSTIYGLSSPVLVTTDSRKCLINFS